ncbi:hypothetical protein GMAR_ORF30 [Golden Marseillevirus]|uniref:hypothetical protein n=1 Tax=Golden Marseillevirus TaxID=1720526 RepID=UPI000877AC29|nr:hypothetical protein GMAR_ORF30 [Golden Marseillevirus]ALX27405.1 hypothetical protein GMAR_ORF30 [Golden Marseillevirus]
MTNLLHKKQEKKQQESSNAHGDAAQSLDLSQKLVNPEFVLKDDILSMELHGQNVKKYGTVWTPYAQKQGKFHLRFSHDVWVSFRAKGKGIWKAAVGDEYREFAVYPKKKDKFGYVFFEFPFPIAAYYSPFTPPIIRISGEEVESLEGRGFYVNHMRIGDKQKFFYGAVIHHNGAAFYSKDLSEKDESDPTFLTRPIPENES